MPGRVRQSDIEELKAKADIIEVVSGYVALKPASAGSFKGLCPFHPEKSPSFNVRSSPAFYHCFGCGAGGDVYKFLQEIESISFADAVERLADKTGFALTYDENSSQEISNRSRLLAANSEAASFYQSQLATDEASVARDFLLGRGFDAAACNQFGVGYAPKGWQNLVDHLIKLGYTIDELTLAGLVMASDKGGYDRFRGRVLWPIRDSNSQVLGFGARKLYEDDQGPKYLNTPETPVYKKGNVLYGLDLARKQIVQRKEIVVVEGYTDVMACHLSGHQVAVATCGTAFGEEHIKLINRLFGQTQEPASVIFTFDPDVAGQKAALRVYGDTAKFNALTFVATGPAGLDPSDLRQQRGDAAITQMLEAKKPLFEFVIRHRIAKFSLNDLDSRVAAARSAASVVAEITDPSLRTGYTRALADWVSLDVNEVAALVSQNGRASNFEQVSSLRTSPAPPVPANNPQQRLERQILEILIQQPSAFGQDDLFRIYAAGLQDSLHQGLLQLAIDNKDSLTQPDWVNVLASQAKEGLLSLIRELALVELPVKNDAELLRYAKGVVNGALMQALGREKIDLMAALRRMDSDTMGDSINQIQRQLINLESERRKLM